jgi:hypothetical protein
MIFKDIRYKASNKIKIFMDLEVDGRGLFEFPPEAWMFVFLCCVVLCR